ncbi:SoxR reducing system RseC family protein [Alkalibacter mobilis]|uniref:SoxR reducing system RseC family protein n=1 Tax=Alkalibacter mobilis TaxID=2787712 RepID=UPI00189E2E5D|nr:SoxR reducing system RseC family protein [Alkalibacter mobilis]MBF7095878.1 SoxR reducing system RseC family protein [Alkalibacter mobilis]
MKEIGVVRSITGKKANVTINRHAACGDCGACSVGKEKMTMEAVAFNGIGAKEGEIVEVEMQFTNIMKASMIAYGIPLVMFVVGAIIGFYFLNEMMNLGDSPMPAFFLGTVMTAMTYVIIKIAEKAGKFSKGYEPQITAVIGKCD